MAVITRAYSEVDGQIAEASSVDRVVDDLYTLQAGNVDGSNIALSGILNGNVATSAITSRTINGSAVGQRVIQTSAVINRTLNDQAVDFDKIDYEALLAVEVF